MAGRSQDEIRSAVAAAFESGELSPLESGAMDYMMSPGAYLTDQGTHNAPHLMFLTTDVGAADWGAGVAGSPVMAAPYWHFTEPEPSQMKALPPVMVFLVAVLAWSDGTPSGTPDH